MIDDPTRTLRKHAYDDLGKKIEVMAKQRSELLLEQAADVSGAAIGDLVRETDYKRRLGAIVEWYPCGYWPTSSVWVKVRLLNKDGVAGNRVVTFYNWKLED